MINIDDLIGVRYKDNGRSKITGFDCYGLAIEIEKRFGHELPDLEEIKQKNRDVSNCEKLCLEKVNVKQVSAPEKEGDILFMKDSTGILNHVGVYLGDGRFIHCNKYGVHIEKVVHYKMMIGRIFTWL